MSEAKNLATVLTDYPEFWIKTVAYCLLIFTTGIWLLLQNLENKTRLAMLFAAFVASVLLTIIQYRTIGIGFFASIPICVMATELIARKLIERFGRGSWPSMAGQVATIIMLSTTSWALIGSLLMAKPAQSSSVDVNQEHAVPARKTCFFESDYKVLAALPRGHVISGLNSAPSILVFTDKSVVSGPYHRNQQGILDVMDFFLTDEAKALEIADRHTIDYVVLCRTFSSSGNKVSGSKTLRDRLLLAKPPPWLEQLSADDDKLLVFRVKS